MKIGGAKLKGLNRSSDEREYSQLQWFSKDHFLFGTLYSLITIGKSPTVF